MANVKVYALSTCIHCRNARKFLDEQGVPYDCVEVDGLTGEAKQCAIDEIKKVNPRLSFPTILIGDEVVVGFQKDDILKALQH